MAKPAVSFHHERYCKRVLREADEWRPWEDDALGVLRGRVAKELALEAAPPARTPAWARQPRFAVPASPPSSRIISAQQFRSFHLGINKASSRSAQSFDKYAATKGAVTGLEIESGTELSDGPRDASAYDVYAIGHGSQGHAVPDHHTTLSQDPDIRRSQWDAIEAHERSLRVNCEPGPPRLAIFYERAPALFDHAARLPDCAAGLRDLIVQEQVRVAAGVKLPARKRTLGVAWIDEGAPAAIAWLERLPGWDNDATKGERLARLSEGRAVFTHVSGEAEYPVPLLSRPAARARVRSNLITWLNAGLGDHDAEDGSILPAALFDHAPDSLNDRRNIHLHFIVGTRRAFMDAEGKLTFAENKVDAITRLGFVERLRGKFAELVNAELALIDAGYRLHPGTHREMGIDDAQPNRKLFGRAVVLERAGVPTTLGLSNDIENWRRRFEHARKRHRDRLAAIERLEVSKKAMDKLRHAALLRLEAEEIALLVGMSVSRAKRTLRFAPAYAASAKRQRDREGWLVRAHEARMHLAELNVDLAQEHTGIVERRREAARLERAAQELIADEALRAQEAAVTRSAGHRAVDLIAQTPVLITERNGAFVVDACDDPGNLIDGTLLHPAEIQKRLRGQHAAQRRMLAQVRSFIQKHGYEALFDDDRIRGSAWMRGAIEQWRSSPILKREESERRHRAARHRAMLDTRRQSWIDPETVEAFTASLADGSIAMLQIDSGIPQPPETPLAPVPTAEPSLELPIRSEPPAKREMHDWTWRPKPAVPISTQVVAQLRSGGMDGFALDPATFPHILSAPPNRSYVTDGRLADALGSDAVQLTAPEIHNRLQAVWWYHEVTRADLVSLRHVPHYIPDPMPPRDPALGLSIPEILADRARHQHDERLIGMFDLADEGDAHGTRLPLRNRLFRVTLAALEAGADPEVCRLLADAAIAQPGSRALRQTQLSQFEDQRIWAASSMPQKGIFRQHPRARARSARLDR